MMDINTIHWFPNHIADMRDFQEIAKAYDYLLMQAMDNMQKVFKNQFLNTLDEDGCAMHEQILGIGANPVDTLGAGSEGTMPVIFHTQKTSFVRYCLQCVRRMDLR